MRPIATSPRGGETPAVSWPDTAEAAAERAAVAAGRLPARYGERWEEAFLTRVARHLRPGMSILDVGSGARPTVPVDQRPARCTYVGLDICGAELERAGPGAYQETIVADICRDLPALAGRFDLVVSWQVLEHVGSLRGALATQHAALAEDGRMVAMLSGAWALYAIAARVIPYRVSTRLQARLLGVEPQDKFPTRYDGCTARRLRRLLEDGGWSSWEIEPRYKAGGYLRFSPALQAAYLRYENWAARRPHPNLATHYIVEAVA